MTIQHVKKQRRMTFQKGGCLYVQTQKWFKDQNLKVFLQIIPELKVTNETIRKVYDKDYVFWTESMQIFVGVTSGIILLLIGGCYIMTPPRNAY